MGYLANHRVTESMPYQTSHCLVQLAASPFKQVAIHNISSFSAGETDSNLVKKIAGDTWDTSFVSFHIHSAICELRSFTMPREVPETQRIGSGKLGLEMMGLFLVPQKDRPVSHLPGKGL